ncbi:MAG: hypothetical protein GY832_30750 [Chloroflexi bacterium]|nr:hypothetical protein [Chloroflexota bacterium]
MGNNILVDIVGWLGVATLLVAYVLVSTKRMEGDSVMYQVLNLVGAALLIVNSSYYGAFPSVGVNVLWVGIAIYTLVSKRKSV